MKVPRDESVASHIGPESCAGIREGSGEALTGESIGQPLSRERSLARVPTPFPWRKAARPDALSASVRSTRRGRRPWHVQTLLAREPGDLALDRSGRRPPVRVGEARSRSRR